MATDTIQMIEIAVGAEERVDGQDSSRVTKPTRYNIPSLFHINQESRWIAFQAYQEFYPNRSSMQGQIYVNFPADQLSIRNFPTHPARLDFKTEVNTVLRVLEVDFKENSTESRSQTVSRMVRLLQNVVSLFPNLEELYLRLENEATDGNVSIFNAAVDVREQLTPTTRHFTSCGMTNEPGYRIGMYSLCSKL
jgi:hypothetical protein